MRATRPKNQREPMAARDELPNNDCNVLLSMEISIDTGTVNGIRSMAPSINGSSSLPYSRWNRRISYP